MRKPRTVVVVAACVPMALLLTACGSGDSADIEVGTVTRGNVTESVEAPATVAARSTVQVTSPASGTVKSLKVTDGETVRKGEVLLVVNSPQAQQNLAAAKSADEDAANAGVEGTAPANIDDSLAASDAAVKQATDAAEAAARQLPAGPARTAALAQVAQARAAYATARAQTVATVKGVNAASKSLQTSLDSLAQAQRAQTQAAVTVAQRTVDALTVRAPAAGVVTLGGGTTASSSASDPSALVSQLPESVQGAASSLLGGSGSGASASTVAKGLPVTSGQTLASVTDITGLSLTAQVDETDVLIVKPGIEASVQLDAVPDATYAARVTSVGVTPVASSRGGVSYVVHLALGSGKSASGGAAPRPLPGMSAVADLLVLNSKNAITVPAAAVFRDGGRDAVWLVEDGKATKQVVQLGAQGESTVAVNSGLKVGDSIVVKGASAVREGQELP